MTNALSSIRLPGRARPGGAQVWLALSFGIAALIGLPVLVVLSSVLQPAGEVWRHLVDTVLIDYVANSLLLMLGVAVGTLCLGVSTAWLTAMFEFSGRRTFEWALLLPLAMPAYIIAFTYGGLLETAGPVQTTLRAWSGWAVGEYWFPNVRSRGGAVLMLSLVLYPYVYMLARTALLAQSVCVLEVSRSLGCGMTRTFFRVALPLARPAIVAGLSLALMETLADYGTVQYLGVATFTTGIFRTWFGLDDPSAAAQLASVLLGFIFVVMAIEYASRKRARFYHTTGKYAELPRFRLAGSMHWLAVLICLLPLVFGFLVPVGQLAIWALQSISRFWNPDFLWLVWSSLWLAAVTAGLAVVPALILAYGQRLLTAVHLPARIASMGYAIPGAVVAVGVMIPFGWLDGLINQWLRPVGMNPGLVFSGTFFALVFAYIVRFLSVSLQSAETGLAKINPNMDAAAGSLGLGPRRILTRIHLPVLRGTMLTAFLLVFVDVLKELPATLILRPFNFNTLAVRAYELASDEILREAAGSGIAIVLAGIIPVVALSKTIARSRPGTRPE